jgi:hypothetical protein
MDYEDVARQAREIENARQQAREDAVQKRARELSISRDLAEYLVGLEIRIGELEQRGR